MNEPTRGLPFGAIYGAMFFVVVAVRARDLLTPPGSAPHPARYALAVLALALALGLVGRRSWARWCGAAFAALVLALGIRQPDPGVVGMIFVLGASIAGLLLLLPATGDTRPAISATRRATSPGAVLLAGAAGLGALGLVLGFWLPNRDRADRSAAAQPAVHSAGRVAWVDFGRGSEQARAEERPMVISFETAWCGFCKKLNRTTWRDAEVISRLAEVVAVRVDAEDTTSRNGFRGRDLAGRFQVEGYPTLLVLDSAGEPVSRISGYLEPRAFLDWLDQSLGQPASRAGGNMQVSGQ